MSSWNCKNSDLAWLNLPDEVWLEIFKKLPQTMMVLVLRNVCQFFRSIAFDSQLWKSVNMNHWKASFDSLPRLALEELYPENGDVDNLYINVKSRSNWDLKSSDLFIPIIERVHQDVTSLTFSQYAGDFQLGKAEMDKLLKCQNLTYLDMSFCYEVNSSTLKSICHQCLKLKTLILEGCR